MKTCSKCCQHKAVTEFNKRRDSRDGLLGWCRACQAAYNAKPKVKAKAAAITAAWQRTPTGKAKHAINQNRYNQSPAGQAARANADANYRRSEFGIKRASSKWRAEDILLRYDMQGGQCAGCHMPFDLSELHKDHNLPLSRDGDNTFANLLLLCRSCNSSKGVKTYAEWLA